MTTSHLYALAQVSATSELSVNKMHTQFARRRCYQSVTLDRDIYGALQLVLKDTIMIAHTRERADTLGERP